MTHMEEIKNMPGKEEQEDTIRKARELISNMQRDAIDRLPMFMKFNFIANNIAGHDDTEINWEEVNRILGNRHEYDFNVFGYIDTVEKLMEAREMCIEAPIFDMGWQKHVCKDCGNEFTMRYNEVEFFRKKELSIPKRCRACRNKRKMERS